MTVAKQVAKWIDTDVIAEEILEELADEGIEPSFENAKRVWYDVLEYELLGAIVSSIAHGLSRDEEE